MHFISTILTLERQDFPDLRNTIMKMEMINEMNLEKGPVKNGGMKLVRRSIPRKIPKIPMFRTTIDPLETPRFELGISVMIDDSYIETDNILCNIITIGKKLVSFICCIGNDVPRDSEQFIT